MAGERYGKRVDGQFTSIILGARLDLLEYLSIKGRYPPAMFSDLAGLLRWARASHKPYRAAWAPHHARADGQAREQLRALHADHVINKARLAAHYPEAWVMLFPVPDRSNSPFGSAVEKALPDVPPGLDLDPLVLFKLLSAEFPKDAAELATQLSAIAGQVPDWCARQVQRAMHERYPAWAPA